MIYIKNYMPRILDKELDDLLEIMGCVLIEGCKWSGKSTTALQKSKSVVYFQNPDMKSEFDNIKNTKPSLFLIGDKPRLFDEWQMYPVLWDSIRSNIDLHDHKGAYILTGSTKYDEKQIMHSGTGRIAKMKMRPMSLFESADSTGEISLNDLFLKKDVSAVSNLEFEDIASLIQRGGWPSAINIQSENKYKIAKEYIKSLINEEIIMFDGIEKNKHKMHAVLKSLSRNVSCTVSKDTILKDVENYFDNEISRPTLDYYLSSLEKLYIIENIYATKLQIRSKTAIRTKPKKIFVDPSLAVASLDLSKEKLIQDLNYLGFLFENLCFRDLLVYSEAIDASLSFYQNENNFEIDAIVSKNSGQWGAIEIKLGSGQIEEAAQNLIKFKNMIDNQKCEEPSFLAILTGTKYSYKREDGVYVISIGSLKF